MCVDSITCVCLQVQVTFTSSPISMGTSASTLSSSQSSLIPWWSWSCQHIPPLPSPTLSLDLSLNTICHLDVLMPSASTLKWEESKQPKWRGCYRNREMKKMVVSLRRTHTLHCTTQKQNLIFLCPPAHMNTLSPHTQSEWHWWS